MWGFLSKTAAWLYNQTVSTKERLMATAASAMTLLKILQEHPMTLKFMGFLTSGDHVHCYEDKFATYCHRQDTQTDMDYAIGVDFDSYAIKRVMLFGSIVWTVALASLYYVNQKRADLIKKLKNASGAGKDLGTIRKDLVAANDWVPPQVQHLLSMAEKKDLSEQQKFELICNYIRKEFPSEILSRVLAEDPTLLKLMDEKTKESLLHIAAGQGSLDFVKMLIEKGCDPFSENNKGIKPRSLAHDVDSSIAQLLGDYEIKQREEVHRAHLEKEKLRLLTASAAASGSAGQSGGADLKINMDRSGALSAGSESSLRLRTPSATPGPGPQPLLLSGAPAQPPLSGSVSPVPAPAIALVLAPSPTPAAATPRV